MLLSSALCVISTKNSLKVNKNRQKHVRFNALLMQRLIVQQIHKHKQKVKWTVMFSLFGEQPTVVLDVDCAVAVSCHINIIQGKGYLIVG